MRLVVFHVHSIRAGGGHFKRRSASLHFAEEAERRMSEFSDVEEMECLADLNDFEKRPLAGGHKAFCGHVGVAHLIY